MKMTKDALLRVIKGTRACLRMKDILNELLMDKRHDTVADYAAGQLCDAVFEMVGEEMTPQQDFREDSQTMKHLTGQMSDEAVADLFWNMNSQPRPVTIERDDMREKAKACGGYFHETPEGEWGQSVRKAEDDKVKKLACELVTEKADNMYLRDMLREAGNELCLKCGDYRREHEGACDGCRWRRVKSGEMPG